MTLSHFIDLMLGVPFKPKGRDVLGVDCWAVPVLAYRDILGIELPSFVDDYVDPGDTEASRRVINDLVLMEKQRWEKVSRPKAMDVVVFRFGDTQTHIGMMVDEKCFIHCERKINTVIERVGCAKWKKRVEGFYRFHEGAIVENEQPLMLEGCCGRGGCGHV